MTVLRNLGTTVTYEMWHRFSQEQEKELKDFYGEVTSKLRGTDPGLFTEEQKLERAYSDSYRLRLFSPSIVPFLGMANPSECKLTYAGFAQIEVYSHSALGYFALHKFNLGPSQIHLKIALEEATGTKFQPNSIEEHYPTIGIPPALKLSKCGTIENPGTIRYAEATRNLAELDFEKLVKLYYEKLQQ